MKTNTYSLTWNFIKESNRIEGIHRDPTAAEGKAFQCFMAQDRITIKTLKDFVKVYQPDARLRDKVGLNVRVGQHLPPKGGPEITHRLQNILDSVARGDRSAYDTHMAYETLHPFTDGNGRSGRALWAWQMRELPRIGFLHSWYYQSLQYARKAD